jgi:uncharacterized protein (DUF697 family)
LKVFASLFVKSEWGSGQRPAETNRKKKEKKENCTLFTDARFQKGHKKQIKCTVFTKTIQREAINMENITDILLWIGLLGCVLPLVVLTVLALSAFWFGKRWLENLTEPDVEAIHEDFIAMKAKKPDADRKELIQQVVNRQALKCGAVGFVTGFGGFVTLPVTLPVDILMSVKIQSTMVSYIAQAYGYENSLENKAATYAIMSGSGELTKVSLGVFRQYAPRFIGKSFSKLVPFLGALLSFAVNYIITQSTARLAIQWYETKSEGELLQEASAATG